MNKSTLERQTGCTAIEIVSGGWGLFEPGDDSPIVSSASRIKLHLLFQELNNRFWEKRRKQVFERDGFKCVVCRSPFNLSIDHIKNRSQGGTHDMSNLQTLCSLCHEEKTGLKGQWAR